MQKGLTSRKKNIANIRKHDFFQDIIANMIFEILTFSKSVKSLNALLKSSKLINIKQYGPFC